MELCLGVWSYLTQPHYQAVGLGEVTSSLASFNLLFTKQHKRQIYSLKQDYVLLIYSFN